MNSYQKGKRWGYAIFQKNVRAFGRNDGAMKSDAACTTCARQAATGVRGKVTLTKQQRAFYRGAVKGFQEFYNKKF